MMAAAEFIDFPPPPQSLLLYPTLIDQTSLSDLPPLIRNRNYHAHRDNITKIQLEQLILANALIARLGSVLYYAHSLLVRLVVNDHGSSGTGGDFSSLNQAAQELQRSITTKCSSSLQDTIQPDSQVSSSGPVATKSFLDELSPTATNTVLNFLNTVRTDPTFLATRLHHSKDQDLDALVSWTPHHHIVTKSKPDTRHNSAPSTSLSPVDYVTSFHRHNPLFVLSSVIFPAPPRTDSPDCLRRMDVWSSCLARLIDEKRGDRVVSAVLDMWSDAKWECSSAFEVAILGFLQNAAKLNSAHPTYDEDCDDESTVGPDPELLDLCDKTLIEILEIVDGPGGIPSPVLSLAYDVFRKSLHKDHARVMLFRKCLVENFLGRTIKHPEYRGLLNESYISEDQRMILQTLYDRLERAVTSIMEENPRLKNDDEHLVDSLIESLISKVFPSEKPHNLDLTDFPETATPAVIVLSPSDLLTIFYALYPKYRPQSASQPHHIPTTSRHARKPSDESNKSEIARSSSDYIRPILKKTHMFDFHEGSTSSQSETERTPDSDSLTIAENDDMDMYGLSVKAAIDEMKRRLSSESCSGERHPCEEMWVTLYISEDALTLSPVPAFELSEPTLAQEEDVIISKEDDGVIETAILKVAANAPVQRKPKKKPIVVSDVRPHRLDNIYHEDLIHLAPSRISSGRPTNPISTIADTTLLSTLRAASANAFTRGDYIEAQSFQHVQTLLKTLPQYMTRNNYTPVLGIIGRKIQTESNDFLTLIRTREVWFSHLLEHRRQHEDSLSLITALLSQTRCKMWYSHRVRQSKAWQRAKEVCEALQKMKSAKSGTTTSTAPISDLRRNTSVVSLHRSSSMQKTDSRRFLPSRQSFDGFSFSGRPASLYNVSFGSASDDWFDILPAPTEQGGPHKLSDYQVEITNRWLEEHASENFCRGEEIIHRFIAEVDDVARRLVPDTADEMSVVASTFWESEEFLEEAMEFGLLELGGGGGGRRDDGYTHGRRSEEIPRNQSGVDLFGLLGRSRGRTVGDGSDTRSIRSTHSHSRTASLSVNTRPLPDVFVRPSSSHSVSYPPPSPAPSHVSRIPHPLIPMSRSGSSIDEKGANQFLQSTRQRLLSLLLSDLGMEMWAMGSETDEWFADGLADACLERKRLAKKNKTARAPRKDKKLSIVPGSVKPPPRSSNLSDSMELPTPPLSRESSGTNNDDGATSYVDTSGKSGFDFRTAYKKLLTRFSVHPAPHEKLNALFDLERLMTASLATITVGDEPFPGRPHLPPTPVTSPRTTRVVSTSSAIGTDELIDEIQRVLRDPDLRPKTLFRDLAFISSFIPPVTLTHHGEGKVFWDIGLAASAMKTDIVTAMVDWYSEIMAGNERPSLRRTNSGAAVGKMGDAARMLVIAACEGDAIGQRELALLHLSHPTLLPLTTLPLTRPSDTFSKVGVRGGVGEDKDKYDPDRIALATHWFRLAAKNGDRYAQNVEGNWLGSKS